LIANDRALNHLIYVTDLSNAITAEAFFKLSFKVKEVTS